MPILRKKSSRKVNTENGNDNLIGDVTIDDFANSSRTHARFKKAVTNFSSEGALTIQRRSRKANSSERIIKEEGGVDYPLDIWFIISEYISPEAIGKFARICRSSYHVTTTGKFWFHLYKSYYRFVPGLPERLQPQCMVRTHGLRACVIRTLHYTYFALKREVDDVSFLRQDEPHSLVKRQCCLMWHKKGKMRWYFFFKLKEIPKSTNSSIKQETKINKEKTDFLEMLEDVAVNPEEGCKILRVTCLNYSMFPPVIGLILQSVTMTLMPGFKNHRLQLGFGTSNIPNTSTNQVILNDVINCHILDWWHPSYPHQDGMTVIKLPQSDFWDQSLL
ncbi:PREDICTED: transmembrane protein 183B isoform X2 [Habropoda laboriosa]|uniref:transmembrane protein 183B isoform X2 n=1 Tax=Habropoda laboriosa TaxID=597456 RepID=UPI00083D3CB7|nr:PREDICTED: transmembrane protein 183B isoform X2 [Habropoda laboriosa]